MILFELFLSFIQIGFFSIGGGMASIPLIKDQIVDVHGWLNLSEFVDLITIAEMTPGPIAINSATFVGTKVAGLPGALISTAGVTLPSILIVLTLAYIFNRFREVAILQGILKGLRPAVIALISSAGMSILHLSLRKNQDLSLTLTNLNFLSIALIVFSLILLKKYKMNPISIIALSGLIGFFVYLFTAQQLI